LKNAQGTTRGTPARHSEKQSPAPGRGKNPHCRSRGWELSSAQVFKASPNLSLSRSRVSARTPRLLRAFALPPRASARTPRAFAFWRTALTVLTLLGWCVLSNHCALGRLATMLQAQAPHSCCQTFSPGPDQPPPCPGAVQGACCQSLHALLPDAFKGAQPATAPLLAILPALLPAARVIKPCPAVNPATGPPPRVSAFTELVLHRSLRANAPPRLA
jgi:hypothetical protein